MYECNIEVSSCNFCCRGEAVSVTHSECVSVTLVIQHTKPVRRIILYSAVCLALPYFSTLSHKRRDFRKKKKTLFNIRYVLISLTFCVSDSSHSEKYCQNIQTFSCNVNSYTCQVLKKSSIFWGQIF
jgi:hypothetical protein